MKHIEKLLWWLITGKRGWLNRAKIIEKLHERPYNAHHLSEELDLDYKTIRHHLTVLEENKVIIDSGDDYGKLYFLTDVIEDNYDVFDNILRRVK